jgi:hypothetical protein
MFGSLLVLSWPREKGQPEAGSVRPELVSRRLAEGAILHPTMQAGLADVRTGNQ